VKEIWHLMCDGEYQYSVFCEESRLGDMMTSFLMVHWPMNEPITCKITFEKVDLDGFDLQPEEQ
jgi:hypothetical protein